MKRLAGIILMLIVGALSCAPDASSQSPPPDVYIESFGGNYSVYRITDTRYGVVCYGRTGYEGVSCLPLDSLKRRAR